MLSQQDEDEVANLLLGNSTCMRCEKERDELRSKSCGEDKREIKMKILS